MKSLLSFNLVIFSIIFSIPVKGYTSGLDSLLEKIYVTDSAVYELIFYNSKTIKSIQSFRSDTGSMVSNGYKYNFYKNNRIESIELFRNGEQSPFLLEFDNKGRYYTFMGPGVGANIIEILEQNLTNQKKPNAGIKSFDDNYYTTADNYNSFSVQYNIKTGRILRIYEYDYINNYSFTKNGIDIVFVKNKLSFIKSYKGGHVAGESFYLNSRGRLSKVLFTNTSTGYSVGVKIRDLYNFINN